MKRLLWLALGWLGCAHGAVSGAPPSPATSAGWLQQAGRAAEASGDSVRAEQYYAASLSAGGEPGAGTADLVRVCVQSGRLRSALAHAEPELARSPRDAALAQLVGGLYLALGDLGRAEAALRQALAASEHSALAHYTLALVLARTPTRRRAMALHLRRYLELAPAGPHRARVEHLLLVDRSAR